MPKPKSPYTPRQETSAILRPPSEAATSMKYFLFGSLAVLFLILGLLFWASRFGDSSASLPGPNGADLTSQAVPGHIEALRHADAVARKKAATALWQIGSYAKAATPALREAAKDPDPE